METWKHVQSCMDLVFCFFVCFFNDVPVKFIPTSQHLDWSLRLRGSQLDHYSTGGHL